MSFFIQKFYILAVVVTILCTVGDVALWVLAPLAKFYPRILFYPDLASWSSTLLLAVALYAKSGVRSRALPLLFFSIAVASRVGASWDCILQYPSRPLIGFAVTAPHITLPLHAVFTVAAAACLTLPPESLGPTVATPRLKPRQALLLSFAWGVFIRALPEVLYWPYIVGYDTVEYAAAVRSMLQYGWVPFLKTWWYGGWENRPPLLYAALYVPAALGLDTALLVKVAAPLVYGLLALSVALWASRAGLEGWWLVAASAFVSSYYVVLGFSWQLLSNVLGVALALTASLRLEGYARGDGKALPAVALALAACSAHQTSTVMIAVVSAFLLLLSIRDRRKSAVLAGVLAASLLLLAWYMQLQPVAPVEVAGGAPLPKPASLAVATEGLVARFLRMLAGYYYLILPFAAYAVVRLRGLLSLKLLFLSFAASWLLLLLAGFTYASPLRMAVVPSPLVALLAFLGLERVGKKLAALYLILAVATGLHYACSRSASVVMANAFPGAFEGEAYFPSGMVSSVLSPELQLKAESVGRVLWKLANKTAPAFVAGANYYVYMHLAGGFNPYVTWVLSPHEVKYRLASMGLSPESVKGVYIAAPKGWLPDWARPLIVEVHSSESIEVLFVDKANLANFTELMIVRP